MPNWMLKQMRKLMMPEHGEAMILICGVDA